MLRLEGIEKAFDGAPVLRGLDLCVEKGEFVTLLGPSGCGKTTTLRIIAGLLPPDKGRVFLGDAEVTNLPPEKRPVNTVFQNYALFPHMNVEKNIAYGLTLRRAPLSEKKARVKEMLELVRLAGFEKRMPSQLSGGQRQRVAIARAVILNPMVLLLDEPLGALDLQLRRQMQEELKALQRRLGITFIYITHDQEEALNMSDRIVVMNQGRFEQIGAPEDVYERPKTRFVAGFIGTGALFEGAIAANLGDTVVVETPCGRMLSGSAPDAAPGRKALVSVHAERIRYGLEEAPGFSLQAEILSHRFAGSVLKTELRLNSGKTITVNGSAALASLPPPGSRVFVYWAAKDAALILEADA